MEKASFIPHAWVVNTCKINADTLPRQSGRKQVMSFAQWLKRMGNPVRSALQLLLVLMQPNR